MARRRQMIGNDGGGIERVGVILPKGKIGRQHRTPCRRERLQRQREMPGFVRGRADEPTQVGQIEQPHLRVGDGFARLQPYPTLKQRLRRRRGDKH